MMNKEIIFQAYSKKEKKIFNVARIDFQGNVAYIYETDISRKFIGLAKDRITLCYFKNLVFLQYIGLNDKLNREIFESYIVEFDNGDKGFIIYEYGGPALIWIGEPDNPDQMRDFYRIEKARIIGNIYENPELLDDDSKILLVNFNYIQDQ